MRNRTKTSSTILWASGTLVIGLLLGFFIFLKVNSRFSASQGDALFSRNKLHYVTQLILNNYETELDADSLLDKMISSTLYSLDPHSRYFTPEEMEKESSSMEGHFYGIGVSLRKKNDTTRISQVFQDGPSYGKLRPGDYIVSIDGRSVAGEKIDVDDIIKMIRGKLHTKVELGIKRYGEEGVRHVTLVRDVIKTNSINYYGMLDASTGYISLMQFTETSHSEFRQAVMELQKRGMQDLILDLRSNTGGLLKAATGIADELLPGNELIVYTKGAHDARKDSYSHAGGLFAKGKLAILINEYSASASEIVAGAVQDNDRGIIIGRRSFGKGLVQQQFHLPDGSAVWLTTSRYYTPSGRCIQRPYDKGSDEYYMENLERLYSDFEKDTCLTYITDSTPYYTAQGRVVYGGGGIFPDYVQPVHSDPKIVYYNQILHKDLFFDFTMDYVAKHWDMLQKSYPTEGAFEQKFVVSEKMWNDFLTFAEKNEIKRDGASIAKYGGEMRLRLKAEIGSTLFNSALFSKIMLPTDEDINDAKTILKKHKIQ